MPYKSIDELPEQAADNLPGPAQRIYLEAFNNVRNQYRNQGESSGDNNREKVAHKVAWSAVKQSYSKSKDGEWHKTN